MHERVHTEARSTRWVLGRTALALALGGGVLLAGAAPEIEIANGLVRATVALPDAASGFYRGTRFDWSGVITSLESQGHTYFGRWYKAHDPALRDVEFTGRQVIETPVYAHNFLVIDGQPSGPDFVITLPFEVREAVDTLGILRARGRDVAFLREPDKDERAMVSVAGFGNDPKDFDIRVENRRTGAGVRITADRPVARLVVWAIRPTRCPEAFIEVRVEPGREFTWRITYEFYKVPKTEDEVPDQCHGWPAGTPPVR